MGDKEENNKKEPDYQGDELQENIRKDGYEGKPPENAQPPFPEGEPQDSTDPQETQDE